ncbi:MAG: efflux RND transporter periplasmic adaptor subunit [Gammaproteobacteria bacterium]|nr:MAG: efflux RND transporter periplasmic adaptor subunit [Gammaproteobacteria bacterium]
MQAKIPLKGWLKQQKNLIHNCISAVLVRVSENGNLKFSIRIPEISSQEKYSPDQFTITAIKEVTGKKRLHLLPVDNNQMLMAHPIVHQGQFWGVVILHLDSSDKKVIAESLVVLQQGMVWLQFLLSQQQPQHEDFSQEFAEPKSSPQELARSVLANSGLDTVDKNAQTELLMQLMTSLLKEKSLQETAISLVNFFATQLQATRVSFGVLKNNTIELTAVSFSANFDKRTSAMQAISDAMDEAIDQRTDIHFDENALAKDEPVRILRCHENLLREQQTAAIDSFLLRKDSRVIGALTIEYKTNPSEQSIFLQPALALVSDLVALKQAGENNIRQQLKARLQKKLHPLLGEKKLTQKIAAITAIAVFFILLFPARYWVTSDASLQSTFKYLVVSPQDGYLESIKARPGTIVKKGDLLAQLNDEELRLERRKLFSQMQQSQQEYDNALANGNRAQAAISNEKVEQASSQLQLIEQQQSRMQLVASSDGIITSDDISQSLGAPVKQGQTLFEISANQGYLVQLWVNERDITALQPDQLCKIKLTSIPNEVFEAKVKSITPISEIREGRNYFRVEATLNRESAELRPGMTGSGKVLAGRELLGWIWFHDVWYWLRLKLWL